MKYFKTYSSNFDSTQLIVSYRVGGWVAFILELSSPTSEPPQDTWIFPNLDDAKDEARRLGESRLGAPLDEIEWTGQLPMIEVLSSPHDHSDPIAVQS